MASSTEAPSRAIANLIRLAQRACRRRTSALPSTSSHRSSTYSPSSARSFLSKDSLSELSQAMNEVREEDVRLSRERILRLKNITYMHIYEEPDLFTMGVFILPPKVEIPLHDHPGMTVLSSVLCGDLHVFSCDWVASSSDDVWKAQKHGGMARVRNESVIRGPSLCTLDPDRQNIHAFRGGAETGCAILDILTPPYDDDVGRSCTYYRIIDKVALDRGEHDDDSSDNEANDDAFVSLVPYSPRIVIDDYADVA